MVPSAASLRLAPAVMLVFSTLPFAAAPQKERAERSDKDKPSLTLKASPMMTFSPAKIVLTAELKGGPNDYEEYYCPTIEWDWDDGTKSESTNDCDPYEAGKSEIKRRFTVQHEYKMAGAYKVAIRLKRKDKALASANVTVQVRPGLREPGGF
jgi:hypothetical protein